MTDTHTHTHNIASLAIVRADSFCEIFDRENEFDSEQMIGWPITTITNAC